MCFTKEILMPNIENLTLLGGGVLFKKMIKQHIPSKKYYHDLLFSKKDSQNSKYLFETSDSYSP